MSKLDKAFDKLFADFYREMDLTEKALKKAIKHWESCAKTYEKLYNEAQDIIKAL